MVTTDSQISIVGDWRGTCVFGSNDAFLPPIQIELSLVARTAGQGRFIGELANVSDDKIALVCGSLFGRTLRFSGSFRSESDNIHDAHAEFAGTVSNDAQVIRGTLRMQVILNGQPIKLVNGSWYVRRVDETAGRNIEFHFAVPAS